MGPIPSDYGTLDAAIAYLQKRLAGYAPEIVVVLGSGLGDVAQTMSLHVDVPFAEIPGFANPTTHGHRGKWLVGEWAGRPTIVLQGRLHLYEGLSWEEVTRPIRCAAHLGVRTALFTNMNGALNAAFRPGQLILVSDHINLMQSRGADLQNRYAALGRPPLPTYSPRLIELLQRSGAATGVELATGVYVGVTGPNYETPAEIRAFRKIGGDVIGMSTIGEALAARSLGVECAAISCVANMAAGVTDHPICHEEVLATAHQASSDLLRLITDFLPRAG